MEAEVERRDGVAMTDFTPSFRTGLWLIALGLFALGAGVALLAWWLA